MESKKHKVATNVPSPIPETHNEDTNSIISDDNNGTWLFADHRNNKQNKIKIPRIQIDFSKNGFSSLHSTLTRNIGKNNFTINAKGDGTGARIFSSDLMEHRNIVKFLQQHGYHFHTYIPADQKKKCFIIGGLNSQLGYDTTEIANELLRAGFPNTTQVLEHITGLYPANNGQSLYKIIVDIFKQIRSLFGVGVKFERFI